MEEVKKIGPSCSKASAILGLVGATLADFAHSPDTSYCQSLPNGGNVTAHIIPDTPMTVSPVVSTPKFRLYRSTSYSELSSMEVVVRINICYY